MRISWLVKSLKLKPMSLNAAAAYQMKIFMEIKRKMTVLITVSKNETNAYTKNAAISDDGICVTASLTRARGR